MTGIKHDMGKDRMDLIPAYAERMVARVLTYGAAKYSPDNWRYVDPTRYLAAAMRHINAYRMGEILDPESGLPHLAHAITGLMFVLEGAYEKARDVCRNDAEAAGSSDPGDSGGA